MYFDISEGSELILGRSFVSLIKFLLLGLLCSDIIEFKKDYSFNSKVKIKRYMEGIC